MNTLCEISAMCKSVMEFSHPKITFFANGASAWGTWGSSNPLRIHLPTKKTGSSQDFPGSYHLQNSQLELLQGAGY